ncbi:LysR family transcriptional regulator [Polaribacter dokdonensis]|uniref:Transcriptional regulator, LysR family n=1 Tax=Polaribacter dokdonensis DSW-5 TaxID=1300348 RepID=A0A0N0CG90_9FLAO|nr:LysR family transcriptional regulator [Polaribacter dokdonensis]KOY53004.1 Transcriptional regulator, LysR family [Polaribacter dokdonensis DSW-5]SEE55816.1 DNA-binding transcriptional regulator, LysR family [Polaribacter dokdonensis DSW-5]
MNYTLHQLEIFKKVAELKSVTKASEQLFMSQPAVSIQLKNFQDQFKLPLFEIVGRKLYITEFGNEIAKAATKILDEVQAINYKSNLFEGKLAGKLNLSIVSTAKYAMPYFLTDFIKENDSVDVTMDVTNKMSVIRALENNECDFAMVSTIPKKLKIERIELMSNQMFFVAGKDYKVEGKEVNIKNLNKSIFLFRENGSATRLAMERFLIKNKIEIIKKMELTSNEAVKQAVIAGLGISIMPIIGIQQALKNGELQILNIKGLPLETNWNLIWLKTKNLSNVAKAFRDYISENKNDIIDQQFPITQIT